MTSEKMSVPDRDDLEQLYWINDGRSHLVYYAWRNALKALPKLGEQSMQSVWGKSTVRHVYAVCSIVLMLAQYSRSAGSAVASALSAAKHVADDINFNRDHMNHTVAAVYAVSDAAGAAITGSADDIALCAYVSSFHSMALSTVVSDYSWLRKTSIEDLESQWLEARPLFNDEALPEEWLKNKAAFLKELHQIGLDFLADDLALVLEGQSLGNHASNYFLDLSETVTNNPNELRKVILGEADVVENHAVRILLLGPGGAGKTSLADRLQQKEVQLQQNATGGIVMQQLTEFKTHFPVDVSGLESESLLDLHLWDFGGQAIFHGLHHAFLHENCVYVLVVDSRHEQAPDEWLHQIRQISPNAKLLLVTNEYEGCHAKKNQVRLMREFPTLLTKDCFFYFPCNCLEPDGFDQFIRALVQAARASKKRLLSSTVEVANKIKSEFESRYFLKKADIERLIDDEKNASHVMDDLDALGFIVPTKMHHDDGFCLKPDWVVTNGYKLLHSEQLQSANGLVTYQAIKNVFADQLDETDIAWLVDFLMQQQVCFQIQNESKYFFPDAASSNEPERVGTIFKEEEKLTLRFVLPYFPLGIHARLVSRLHNSASGSIKSTENVWRHGFIFESEEAEAVVQYLMPKGMLELTFFGEVRQFANLLNDLNSALINKEVLGVSPLDIHLYIVGGGKMIATQPKEMIALFKKTPINSIPEIIKGVEEVADKPNITIGTIMPNAQVAIGQGIKQTSKTGNTEIRISVKEHEALNAILEQLKKQGNPQLTSAVETLQAEGVADSDEGHSVLSDLYHNVKSVADFAGVVDNLGKATDFVTTHLYTLAPYAIAAAAALT